MKPETIEALKDIGFGTGVGLVAGLVPGIVGGIAAIPGVVSLGVVGKPSAKRTFRRIASYAGAVLVGSALFHAFNPSAHKKTNLAPNHPAITQTVEATPALKVR